MRFVKTDSIYLRVTFSNVHTLRFESQRSSETSHSRKNEFWRPHRPRDARQVGVWNLLSSSVFHLSEHRVDVLFLALKFDLGLGNALFRKRRCLVDVFAGERCDDELADHLFER